MMHSSRAAFVSGHAQQIFMVGFFGGVAAVAPSESLEPLEPMALHLTADGATHRGL
eukprot:CAMPEP_0170575982 /NCGR_PEP_ID=MMETSP0224-20130122/4151_1 /TAXON_ID=285029 /ORGANISM="Togula jolla, Strain CCCM 725" /LENGTH=55 /DNA_ID=CAMNT_0010898797 /DNA_START=189 /DNA_END=356 /DNA_ORIENTATION=-